MNTLEPTQIYRAFTRYNRWMNEKLLAQCSKLSDEERKQNRAAPFGSLHGLWNHLLLADRAWLCRFAGQPVPFKSVDEEICADWEELKIQRALTDDHIDEFIATLTAEKLISTLRITALSRPRTYELPLLVAVQHLFNHQTHHRGQITALMEQAGLDCGVTDFAALPDAAQALNF